MVIGRFSGDETDSDMNIYVEIGTFILYMIFLMALYPLFKKFTTSTFFKQYRKHDGYDDLAGDRRLIVNNDRLRLESEIGADELRFAAINKIIKTDQSLYLWHNQHFNMTVSLTAFSDPPALQAFLDLLKEKTPAVFLQVGNDLIEHPLSFSAPSGSPAV